MEEKDLILLHTIKTRISEQPEFIGYIISAITEGVTAKVKKANELAADMETLAVCAINMIDKPVLSAKVKKEFNELALSKLEKHKFKTFFEWNWAVNEKKE